MGFKSSLTYLLDKGHITKPTYVKLMSQIEYHDRQIVNNTISKMKHQLSSEVEFSEDLTREQKVRMTDLIKRVSAKMRLRIYPEKRD